MRKLILIIILICVVFAIFKLSGSNREELIFFELKKFDYHPEDKVFLHIFSNYSDTVGDRIEMDFEIKFNESNEKYFSFYKNLKKTDVKGIYYGYEVHNYDATSQEFSKNTIIADPFSKALATQNHYSPINKSIILKDNFNWDGDDFLPIDHRNLIVYEVHLKDMTAHPSSGLDDNIAGTYLGFIEEMQRGGIEHLKDMGYNAVEFLPIFEFANVEINYLDTNMSITNTWNPYEENHWGYMPSFFFAPEGNFASKNSKARNAWNGVYGQQVNEFKELVKELHKNGIAVILDVVYNHISQYDYHPLKQIDKNNYFRKDKDGNYSSVSGCGNDLKTENRLISEMIVESVKYWMNEYHIDGFRFDLGKLIDWKTIEAVEKEAKKINPNVFLTCEPWGGGYDPNGFSDRNWSSWNDQFRNSLKGWHPDGNGGYIFGKWHPGYEREKLYRVFAGSHRDMSGQYVNIAHSLNYLESHDDYTLGDFIRIETKKNSPDEVIQNIEDHNILTEEEIRIHQLAATVLLTSQGPVMIAQGQEWGRSKVIAKTNYPDLNIGKLDHNSYEKDNETNWLNWDYKDSNKELVDFYKKLILLRKTEKAFTHTNHKNIKFFKSVDNEFGIGYELHPNVGDPFLVLMNSSKETANFNLSSEKWNLVLTNNELSNIENNSKILSGQSVAVYKGAM